VGNTDADGEVGRRVAERMAARGVPQRLVVRDPAGVRHVPDAEVAVVGGYDDGDALRRALDGVDTLLLVPVREDPRRVELHRRAVDTAVTAGVRRIVYLSFLAAAPDATFTLARDHAATEEHLRAAGVATTVVRGSAFLDVLRWIVGDDAVIRGPAGTGRFAPVARDDVADVLAAVLLSDGVHDGEVLDVTGPDRLSLADVAAAFARASGRPVRYVEETVEEAWASRRGHGAPDWQVEAWVTTYLQIARGELDLVSDTVPRLTGHPAQTLPGFLAAHPESWAHLLDRRGSAPVG
jgi:uncharacterized protein YbjT (DUF2867 family)